MQYLQRKFGEVHRIEQTNRVMGQMQFLPFLRASYPAKLGISNSIQTYKKCWWELAARPAGNNILGPKAKEERERER